MRKYSIYILLSSLMILSAAAQDKDYARRMVDTLASPYMSGRGYVDNGDRKAADFLAAEMRSMGRVQPLFSGNYFQSFTHDVNIFEVEPFLKVGKTHLLPGKDYLVQAFSGSVKGNYNVMFVDGGDLLSLRFRLSQMKDNKRTAVIIYAKSGEEFKAAQKEIVTVLRMCDVLVLVNPTKLTWTVSSENIGKKAVFEVSKDAFDKTVGRKKVSVSAQPVYKRGYESVNVGGIIPGTIKDSFLLVTAHYDHLGKMGSAVFPGANDNASGTAMMLDLARYYAEVDFKPRYTLVFVAFAAEEAGLVGSKYFVENPVLDLAKIKFVFNIDLMGGGTEGVTVVNGTVHEPEFARMEAINAEKKYVPRVKKRGKAANSDHHWFTENGVPAFFVYAEGGVTAYHDVNDTRENLPLDGYDGIFRLIRDFLEGF